MSSKLNDSKLDTYLDHIKNRMTVNKLISKFPILNTLASNYKYSFNKKILKKLDKYSHFRLIGMGGSTLGAETIYQFLKNKTKKKFVFINNLKPIFSKKER